MAEFGRRGNMVARQIVNPDRSPTGKTMWWFQCPGCDETHGYQTPQWTRTGTDEAPTFTPSLLVRYGTGDKRRCPLSLRAGVLEFLADCTHALAGTKVPLPEPPSWLVEE